MDHAPVAEPADGDVHKSWRPLGRAARAGHSGDRDAELRTAGGPFESGFNHRDRDWFADGAVLLDQFSWDPQLLFFRFVGIDDESAIDDAGRAWQRGHRRRDQAPRARFGEDQPHVARAQRSINNWAAFKMGSENTAAPNSRRLRRLPSRLILSPHRGAT